MPSSKHIVKCKPELVEVTKGRLIIFFFFLFPFLVEHYWHNSLTMPFQNAFIKRLRNKWHKIDMN